MVSLQTPKLTQALAAVPYWCTIIFIICSLLPSASTAKSCKCPCSGSDKKPKNTYSTVNTTFDHLHGYLFDTNTNSSTFLPDGLVSYKKKVSSKLDLLSEPGMFMIDEQWINLWGSDSFSVGFTMSIYQPKNKNNSVSGDTSQLIFAIIPYEFIYTNESMAALLVNYCYWDPGSEAIVGPTILAGNVQFTVYAGEFNNTFICVEIDIDLRLEEGNPTTSTTNYSFLIDYKSLGQNKEVQVGVVDAEGHLSSGNKVLNLSDVSLPFGFFSLASSSMGQLFQLYTWNSTVVEPQLFQPKESGKNRGTTTTIILCSVLGSAAATVAMAVAVYCYFNSKLRVWKKELDRLAKSMQRLPGVPTQFSFSDIQKATSNFHETTKLGRGGFSTVYKCSLGKTGQRQEVAVKKFSRDDNRRYEDFLAEVSVINRLRHKNIVPLVGWSYHKGEPLLIYEYMPNGSLDQHLFRRSGGTQQQAALINRWKTRYNIVKDIATGLHYVHHEYEPMVLHRDIKASNIMIDSSFQGRLGDFGLACVVAEGKNSYTDIGTPGTTGFMAPEYTLTGKATTKSDVFAFGVLILEIVTGKVPVDAQFRHITDWVWNLHKEGRLLNAVDTQLTTEEFDADDAKRLLLLGLACSHPNASDRPNMVEAVQIINKSMPPPDMPLEKPRLVRVQEEGHHLSSDHCTELSSLDMDMTIGIEMTSGVQTSSENGGNSLHQRPTAGPSQELFSIYHTAE